MSSVMEIAMKEMGDLIALAATPKNAVDALKTETVTGIYNVEGLGLVGNGTTDDYTALSALLTTIGSAKATIVFPPGTYKLSSSITIPSSVTLWMLNGAMLSPDSGMTLTINGPIDAVMYQIFSGSGTVVISSSDVLKVFPEWWGAKADGVTNDSSSMQKAISSGKPVELSQGNYHIGSTGLTGIKTIIGAGKGLTTITYSGVSTTALTISSEKSLIRGFSLINDGSPTSGYGIDVSAGSYGTIQELHIRNTFSAIRVRNSQAVKIRDIDIWIFQGFGLLFDGGNNNDHYVSDCFINGQTSGALAGIGTGIRMYDKNEAIMFTNVEIILCKNNLTTDAAVNSPGVRPAYCRFLNCFFDSASDGGIIMIKGVNMEFTQCWLSGPASGCTLIGVDDVSFANCSFINSGQHGCIVQATAKRVKFIGCKFISNSASAAGSFHGLVISGGTTDFIVQGCTATNGLGFSGTQGYGIFLAAGASDRYIIADNLVSGNATSGVADGGTGTNKRVANNY